jgi:hypothetical protein
MRQTIKGLIAAIAVVTASAAPALACGGLFQSTCSPCGQTYVSPCEQAYVPAPVSTCDTGCGGWAHERLAEPEQQYYYADQGPTYSGPGDYAPYPTYREGEVSGWHHPYHYGWHHAYRYGGQHAYHYGWHHAYHYGYEPRHFASRYTMPMRHYYTAHYGAPRYYGFHEHTLRRYY